MIILCIIIYLIIRSNRIKNEEFTRRNIIRNKLISNNPDLNKLSESEIEKLIDKELLEYNEVNKETSPVLIVFVCMMILIFVSIIVSIIVYETG